MVKTEFVKRFETVVTNEIKSHNDALTNYRVEINALKEQINKIDKKLEEKFSKSEQLYDKNVQLFQCEKVVLSHYCNKQTGAFEQLKQHVQENDEKLELCLESLAGKNDLENLKKEVKQIVSSAQKGFLDELEKMYVRFHDLEQKVLAYCEQYQAYIQEHEHTNECNTASLHARIDSHGINTVGLLRELQVYKKSMFIIEKKIENIYTLIERLQEGKF